MFHRVAFAAVVAAIGVAGCFNPRFHETIACSPSGDCPPGQSCGVDLNCHASESIAIDAALVLADAQGTLDSQTLPDAQSPPDAQAMPDAAPVACQGDDECRHPPDICATPGHCDITMHICVFGNVDCSSMNDECNAGICDVHAGGCVEQPAHQGAVCGQGNVCGAFGTCQDFSDTCDSTGMQSRACTQYTCQAGTCTGIPYNDTQTCSRNTDGTSCASPVVSDCSACSGSSENGCALDGHQTCICTESVCMNDTCQRTSSSCRQSCSAHNVGDQCGLAKCVSPSDTYHQLCCNNNHLCSEVCSDCE